MEIRVACFDWGGTLMSEDGPEDTPMGLWPEVRVLPGAVSCLAAIHGKCRIAIATNASVSHRPMIELALRRGNLLGYIDDIFCYTELGYRKDQPEFWQAVQAAMGVPLKQMSMVGDSWEQDVLAPSRFGLRAIWFNEDGKQPSRAHSADIATVTELVNVAPLVLDCARG